MYVLLQIMYKLLPHSTKKLFDVKAEGDETHSIIVLPKFGIAIYSKTAAMNDPPELDCTDYSNDRFYIGFNCDDAATEYERIKSLEYLYYSDKTYRLAMRC